MHAPLPSRCCRSLPQGRLETDPCEWCQTVNSTRVGSVTHIELRNRNISGTLEQLLEQLRPLGGFGLAGLNLADNWVKGSLPNRLAEALPDLVLLNLGSNSGGWTAGRVDVDNGRRSLPVPVVWSTARLARMHAAGAAFLCSCCWAGSPMQRHHYAALLLPLSIFCACCCRCRHLWLHSRGPAAADAPGGDQPGV